VTQEQRERIGLALEVLTLLSVAIGLVGVSCRAYRLERRVTDLENKSCLMSGAHTGCVKVEK
jgi:cell division protein FtsL